MNKHNLHRTAYQLLCYQKIIYHAFILSTVFYLRLNTAKLEWLNLNDSGKPHKTKHLSQFHAAQVIILSYNGRIIYQITPCHSPEFNNVNSEKRTYNFNEFTINFRRYKVSYLSLIAANW